MEGVSARKSLKTDSPKTPGGISRSLLTPCRRVGLSRNWRKGGASPFQSPLSSCAEVKQDEVKTRKRKESLEDTPQTSDVPKSLEIPSETIQTPIRNVKMPRRTKSKTFLASINKSPESNVPQTVADEEMPMTEEKSAREIPCKDADNYEDEKDVKEISTPLRLKSKSRSKKKISPSNSTTKIAITGTEKANSTNKLSSAKNGNREEIHNNSEGNKEKCPNNLTKECIVVIQKKIFKNELKDTKKLTENSKEKPDCIPNAKETISQTLFDSDSDDKPLIELNKQPIPPATEDDDFAENKVKIRTDKTTLKTKMKSPKLAKNKINLRLVKKEAHKSSHSSVHDEGDDDFFEKKRTILIKKSYDKVLQPQKAKSTGSITQKDIDDLKARIEVKKKMLLARAMTEDTQELRDLIKKWKKGCQVALMELMDLMKNKVPDKQNMEYSEILETLKIPASLVGYDPDNDCFLTPNDESIILANLND